MKRKFLVAAGLALAMSSPVFAATAFRSIQLSTLDDTRILINMEAEMQITFTTDSLFLSNPEYSLSFGLKDCKGWSFSTEWSNTPFKPEPPKPVYDPEGNGEWSTPYNVPAWLESDEFQSAWLTGFIVGSFTGTSIADGANFTAKNHVGSTLLLAPAADITDHELCVGVQLPAGNEYRSILNLVSNPDNRGKEIAIEGKYAEVGGKPGLTAPTNFQWGNVGIEPVAIEGVETSEPAVAVSGSFIELAGLPEGSFVSLVDMSGRVVRSVSATGDASIALNELANGVYILNINGKTAKISVKR